MQKLMFYSYKGGTGRTTATANVAAALAKQGKNVLCFDFDLEAPGLHTAFGLDEQSLAAQIPAGISIKNYLQMPTITQPSIPPQAMANGVVDVVSNIVAPRITPLSLPALTKANIKIMAEDGTMGKLHVLPALEREESLVFQGLWPFTRLERLFDHFAGLYDFVIFDSASGLRDLSAIALGMCDSVVLFFRWGYQSFLGTRLMIQILNERVGQNGFKPYILVASSTPELAKENLQDQQLYQNLQGIYVGGLRNEIEGAGLEFCMHSIQEHTTLKWQERLIVFDNPSEATDYDRLADIIIGRAGC